MSERRVLDMKAINDLHALGDIDTLAQALRNIIVVTDDATTSAQAAARARQEYVPTTLGKDTLYRALDAALNADEQVKFDASPGGAVWVADDDPDYEEYERQDTEISDAFRASAAIMDQATEDWDDLPGAFTAEQQAAFAAAAVHFVVALYSNDWFTVPDQDTELRAVAPSPSGEETTP
jgi:hypothetical protein